MTTGEPVAPEASVSPGVANRTVVRTYDRISRLYDRLVGPFEAATAAEAMALLDPRPGECVLELGTGPGRDLVRIADRLDGRGTVLGVDAAPGMVDLAVDRCRRTGVTDVATPLLADARSLPLRNDSVDAVHTVDALELFDQRDLRRVLAEIRRVLREDGRLCAVTMDRVRGEETTFLRAYECVYRMVPYFDRVGCRPIDAAGALEAAGFRVVTRRRLKRGGVWPVDLLLARPV
jgi:demethylmenaquinone methyltransferase/2-methoxy-6-polyprenyl-1,4-benzoquinol methylase